MGKKRKQSSDTGGKSGKKEHEPAPLPATVTSDNLEPVAKKVRIFDDHSIG